MVFKKISSFILVISFSFTAFALNPKGGEAIGLNLIFKPKIIFTSLSRTEFHKQLGFKLIYQSKELGLDFVVPSDLAQWSHNGTYQELCSKYLKFEAIQTCSIEFRKPLKN